MCPGPSTSPAPLFLYLTALNAGVLGVSVLRRWPSFRIAAFLASLGLYLSWHLPHYSAVYLGSALTFIGLNSAIFLGVLALYPLVWRQASGDADLALGVLNPLAAGGAFYWLLGASHSDLHGLVAALFAALYWATARAIRLRRGEEDFLEQLFFSIALAFALLAVPLQFHGRAITAGWALMAAALSVTGYRTGSLRTRIWGGVALALSAGRLLFVDAWQAPVPSAPIFFNERGLSFAVVAGAFALVAALAAREWKASELEDERASTLLALAALALCALMDGWMALDLRSTWWTPGWCAVSALVLAFGWQLRCPGVRAVGVAAVLPPLLRAVALPVYGMLPGETGVDAVRWIPTWVAALLLCAGAAWAFLRMPGATDTEDRTVVPFLAAGAAAAALTWAGVALQHDPGWLPLAWIGILLALGWAGLTTRRAVFRALAAGAAALLTAEVLARELSLPATHLLLLHSRSAAALAVLGAWIACARLMDRQGSEDERALLPVLYAGVNLLAVGWLSLEAWDVAGGLGPAAWAPQSSQFGVSALWAVYAAAAIAVGFSLDNPRARWGGLGLLLLAVAKVFLLDLSFLGSGFRVLSCLVLGIVLLGVSYFYQQTTRARSGASAQGRALHAE